MALIQPTYFAPIIQYAVIAQSDKVVFEVHDNFQKQTYRNRCNIATANGKQALTVPFQHQKGVKLKTSEIKIDYKDNWQIQHLRALETAYSSSPFFEFYRDDIAPLFQTKFERLLELNIATHNFISDAIELEIPTEFSTEYDMHSEMDFRTLAIAKNKMSYELKRYIQVFEPKLGFLSNLSILDLLFMEGPNTLNYLEQQSIPSL